MRRILELLELATIAIDGPLTLTEISTRAEVPLSTTSRLLAQLVSWGFLLENGASQFVPGPRLIRMSVTIASQLHTPEMLLKSTAALSSLTGESVTGGLLIRNTMFIVARTESEHPLRAVNRVGELVSPVTSALGQAIMSRLPRERQLQLLVFAGAQDPEAELEKLDSELTTAVSKQFAIDEGTFAAGLRCRAAPILGADGLAVGGISIGGPAARFTQEAAERAIPLLLREAERLSLNVSGHNGNGNNQNSHNAHNSNNGQNIQF